jgi:hypothetical protein
MPHACRFFDVKETELTSRVRVLGIIRPHDHTDEGLLTLLRIGEVGLVIFLVFDVDNRWVRLKCRVRVVPA